MISDTSANYGDLKRLTVLLNDSDITDAVTTVNVFQDMFAPTNTMIITLMDTTNLLMSLPIRAGARVRVDYETDLNCAGDGEQSWDMIVYKVGDKEVENSKTQTYSIFAADKAFLLNQTKRISRSYRNKPTSTIAKEVVNEFLDAEIDTDTSENMLSVIVPGWTPFHTMSWLLKTSLSENAADFTFFQQHDGKFAFKSFEKMYSSDENYSDITLHVTPTNLNDNAGNSIVDYSTGINVYYFDHWDALSNLSSGFYKNKTVSYDFVNKNWTSKAFSFGDDNSEDKKMFALDDTSAFLMESDNVNISFMPKHEGLFDAGPSYLDKADVWQTSRKSSLMKFEQEKLVVQLPGSAGSAKWFGKSIDVDLPSQDSLTDETFDRQRRGRYLVTAIGHMIGKDTYSVNMELVKKRLEEL